MFRFVSGDGIGVLFSDQPTTDGSLRDFSKDTRILRRTGCLIKLKMSREVSVFIGIDVCFLSFLARIFFFFLFFFIF